MRPRLSNGTSPLGSRRWYGTPSISSYGSASACPWSMGQPQLVTTCGSSPAARCAVTMRCVRTVYPACVYGSAFVTQCRTRPSIRSPTITLDFGGIGAVPIAAFSPS